MDAANAPQAAFDLAADEYADVERRRGVDLYKHAMALVRERDLDRAAEELVLALMNAPEDLKDESFRARTFLALARLELDRGNVVASRSYYRASYLLSPSMLRHGIKPPIPLTTATIEARDRMGRCAVAVVPFRLRRFSGRDTAVEFVRAESTAATPFCRGCDEMQPLMPAIREAGADVTMFVSSHRDSTRAVMTSDGAEELKADLPHAFAVLEVGRGAALLDLRMHADGCGNSACGRGQAVRERGVWSVTIERDEVPFDYPECACEQKAGTETWRTCTGCPGHCECPPFEVTTPSPFGPRETFYVDANNGHPMWHTLEEQGSAFDPPTIDGQGLHLQREGCSSVWPMPIPTTRPKASATRR